MRVELQPPCNNTYVDIESAVNLCKTPNYAHICEKNLGIPRNQMPQIEGDVKGNFLANQSAEGINVLHTIMNARDLTPIQNEINLGRVFALIDDYKKGRFDPCKDEIMVAIDDEINYVIDGHHRYAACNILERSLKVVAIWDYVRDLLEKANSFPGVEKFEL